MLFRSSLTNRVTAAETKISQNSESISLRATKTEVTEAIDGIQIGGRNLFGQSGHWNTKPTWWVDNGGGIELDTSVKYRGYNTIKTTVGSGIAGNYNCYFEVDTNKIYTYSAMIKLTGDNYTGDGNRPLNCHCSSTGTDYGEHDGIDVIKYKQDLVNGEWTLLYITFRPKGKYYRPFVYIGYGTRVINIAYLKLEEGTKPTDWTPAPEDVENDATDKANAALANAKSYTDAQIQVTSESITSTVSKTYATKTDLSTTNSNVTNAQNTANAAATAASNAQSTANTAKSTADSASKSASTANTAASNAQKTADTAKANAATAQSTANSVKNDLASNYSTTTQMNSAIKSVQTELTQTSEEIRMDFNKTVTTYVDGLQNQIDDNTSYTEKQFNTINKYIRFVDGKIILGEMGNELTLTIQNDRLSFMQSNVEVAYFSDNKLYINQAEVLTSLKIGKFEFVPGTNGSLSLRKKG